MTCNHTKATGAARCYECHRAFMASDDSIVLRQRMGRGANLSHLSQDQRAEYKWLTRIKGYRAAEAIAIIDAEAVA